MRIVAVIVAAYLLTGFLYVGRDALRPVDSQPSYIRHQRGFLPKLFIVLYWLPGTLSFASRGGDLLQQAVSWAIFAALIIAGLYFSSI